MIRSLYFIGGLFAMALILFAQTVDLKPTRHASAAAQAAVGTPAAASMADPVATAIDDLAAWPLAAGR